MPFVKLALPTLLRWIDRKKPNQLIGMLADIIGDVAIIDPDAAQFRFPAEDDGASVGCCAVTIGIVIDAQVHFLPGPRPPRLANKVGSEVVGELPCVGVNVDDHADTFWSPL